MGDQVSTASPSISTAKDAKDAKDRSQQSPTFDAAAHDNTAFFLKLSYLAYLANPAVKSLFLHRTQIQA